MKKRGQVWVETVIYTLIGLGLIGLVLSVAIPRLNERRDAVAVDQALDSLSRIDAKVFDVQVVPGNRRIVSLLVGKGTFSVDANNDVLSWELHSRFPYSEPGTSLSVLGFNVTTEGSGDDYTIFIVADYSGSFNITVDGSDSGVKSFPEASVEYSFFVENAGKDANAMTVINVGGS